MQLLNKQVPFEFLRLVFLVLLVSASGACRNGKVLGSATSPTTEDKPSGNFESCDSGLKTGIAGRVLWIEGNRMPSMNEVSREDKGIAREIHAYPLTKTGQVRKTESVFYHDFPNEPLAVVFSDEKGCFEMALPQGIYTLVVKEEKGFYGNIFDGQDHIYPVEVNEGQVSRISFKVDYMAAY